MDTQQQMVKMGRLEVNKDTILINPASKVVGGKRRITKQKGEKLINGGAGERKEFDVTVEVNDVEERQEADNLVQRALQAVRQHSTLTGIGYLTTPEGLGKIMAKYAEIKIAADDFNKRSHYSKVWVTFFPFEIGQQMATNEDVAKALADHVRGELSKLRDTLRAGDVKGATNVLLGCKRMHTLSVGTQASAIQFAIEEGATKKKILKRRIDDGETPESAGRALAMPMIDSAIETFTYAPEQYAPALPADLNAPATDAEMANDNAGVQALVA